MSPFLVAMALVLVSCDEEFETPPEVFSSDDRVDLRPQQTSIKFQGNRNTCISFAAVACLEAAYKRNGYGDLDLSEEFVNHVGKTFWLHPNWSEIEAKGNDGSETQVGAFGGGSGAYYIYSMLTKGLRVPKEDFMPYKDSEYNTVNDPTLAHNDWSSPVYNKQRVMSNFNLDPSKLTYDLQHSDKFYGASKGKFYGPQTGNGEFSRDTDFMEGILRRGFEIAWDFDGLTLRGDIWIPCPMGGTGCVDITHSMLIVGFDKTSSNPDDHYFIVKNSWGSGFTSTPDNFTKVSYEFVRQFGTSAAYISLPMVDPQEWNAFKFVGRWNLVFDGHDGILDIYHLPGYRSDLIGMDDKRIGSFYAPNGKAFKVNGNIDGNKIVFYLDNSNSNARWDEIGGRRFEYYLSDDDYMAGFHTDPDGRSYAGYAIKGDLFSEGALTLRPFSPSSFENSSWAIHLDKQVGRIELDEIEPYRLEFPENYFITGTFTGEDGIARNARMRIPKIHYSQVFIEINLDEGVINLKGQHLNHTKGNISGHTIGETDESPFVMIKEE